MKDIESIYFRFSIAIVLASLTLFLPKPVVSYIWDDGGHNLPILFFVFLLLSFLSGIAGVILVLMASSRKRRFDKLVLATMGAFSFNFCSSAILDVNLLQWIGF